MKKLFFAICFIYIALVSGIARSGTREIIDQAEYNKIKFGQNTPKAPRQVQNRDIPTDREGFIEYIKERAKKAAVTSWSDVEQNSGMNIIHSNEYIAQQAQGKKTTFQKIYEEAINKVNIEERKPLVDILPSSEPSKGPLRSELALQNRNNNSEGLGFEVINVKLPNGETIVAPAKEHIPYLSSKIEIMPNGLVRIVESVTVVANGKKLKYGLTKAIPKYSISREGVRNSTIPYLNGVKINGMEVDYVLKDNFDRFLITPKKQFPLQSGIYTYEFDYILDRKLWYYNEFNEFYWDVTGSFWNLAVTTAIATVQLPINVRPLGQTLMLGYLPDDITEKGAIVVHNTKTNVLGFTSSVPLLAGEGMFMLIRIPKTGFIDPDFNTKFKWFLEDYGDVLFAFLGFAAIFVAYLISWKNIDKSAKDSIRVKYERTPALYRLLAKGVFDKTSFGAFLLDMYRRGIINIVKDNGKVVLSKRVSKIQGLSSYMRKALKCFFPKKETTFTLEHNNEVKFSEAYKQVEKGTQKRLKMILMKLNAGYVIFSGLMILFVEAAMAYLSVDMGMVFGILVSSTIVIALYCLVFKIKIKNKYIRYLARFAALFLIVVAGLFMCNYINLIAVVLIVAMILTIMTYSRLFAKREGLIRHNIVEAKNLEKKLKNDANNIILGHQFANNQANIFALDAVASYPKMAQIEANYKIDLVEEFLNF